jgi:spore coat polysaccharide biosynthesis protein SpsF
MGRNYGIIVQARLGSTRLPAKVIMDIGDGHSFLDVLLQNLSKSELGLPIVLATTTNPNDEKLGRYATKYDISLYRGSENIVLERFIEAAEKHQLDYVIRVCSDNPFLDMTLLDALVNGHENQDYFAYSVNGAPSILTHYGFFAEIVSVSALKKVMESNSPACVEHVTNCVYGNPEMFNVEFIDLYIDKKDTIRCTLDTKGDFETLKEIYTNWYGAVFVGETVSYTQVIKYLHEHPSIIRRMAAQIEENSK